MNSDDLQLKKEMPADPPDGGRIEDVEESDRGRSRLWIAVCRGKAGQPIIIEKNLLVDLRTALNDPEIIDVETIYRGIRKEFTVKTEVVRTLSL
jgi:hypothetical protein